MQVDAPIERVWQVVMAELGEVTEFAER